MTSAQDFDELTFFANLKKCPGLYLGQKSLISLRDQLFGMTYAFAACGKPDALKYFHAFTKWYNSRLFETDSNGYVCWWNYILYTSGASDSYAFDSFYQEFEHYLENKHKLYLPETQD